MTQHILLIYDIADTLVEMLARESRLILMAPRSELEQCMRNPYSPPLCQGQRVFAARQQPDTSALA